MVLDALVEEVMEVVEVSGVAGGDDQVVVVGGGGDVRERAEGRVLGREETGGEGEDRSGILVFMGDSTEERHGGRFGGVRV